MAAKFIGKKFGDNEFAKSYPDGDQFWFMVHYMNPGGRRSREEEAFRVIQHGLSRVIGRTFPSVAAMQLAKLVKIMARFRREQYVSDSSEATGVKDADGKLTS